MRAAEYRRCGAGSVSNRGTLNYKTTLKMSNRMACGIVAVVAAATVSVATAAPCFIHPPKRAPDAQLTSLATLLRADAEKLALARVKSPATVVGAELEAERVSGRRG